MNASGLLIALFCTAAIGIGFVWVIKLEYHLGAGVRPIVLTAGLLVVAVSAFLPGFWAPALTGIFGGTIVWGATELPDQERRARAGHYPVKPTRKAP